MSHVKVWEDGATFIYQGTVINSGGISDVSIGLVPGRGNEFELYAAELSHNDVTASTMNILLRDAAAGNTVMTLFALASMAQNAVARVPTVGTAAATGGNFPQLVRPIMISGLMELFLNAVAIDDLEGITVAILGRVYGGLPTITASPVADETVNTEGPF